MTEPTPAADPVRRAVERIAATQARCGTKLMQMPADYVWPGSKWEAGEVDLEFLVKDILDAAHADGLGREGRGGLGSDLAVSEGGSGVRFPSPDDPPLPAQIDGTLRHD